MNLWVAGLIIAGVSAAAVGLSLAVRRRAPAGGFFADPGRASGVFGVLGTAFAVLLAFVIFLAFQSYQNAKEKAGQEAVAVTRLSSTVALFAPRERDALRGELACYTRAVIADEWPAMRERRSSERVQRWVDVIEARVGRIAPSGARQTVAYGQFFDADAERQEGRRGRLGEADPFVPEPVWLILVLGALLVVGYVLLYADPHESRRTQAAMVAAVTAIVVGGLLVVRFLDNPYEASSGSIEPTQMRRTLELLERGRPADAPPCNEAGAPAV